MREPTPITATELAPNPTSLQRIEFTEKQTVTQEFNSPRFKFLKKKRDPTNVVKVELIPVAQTPPFINGVKSVPNEQLLTFCVRRDFKIIEKMTNYIQTISSFQNLEEPLFIKNQFKVNNKFNNIQFCEGACRIRDLPNAGGNSANSEVLSFEVLNCLLNANLRATEMELEYSPLGSKITDYSIDVQISKDKVIPIGVSVTRAMKFNGRFNEMDAEKLLTKKLTGVNESSKAVLKRFRWKKQVLHIWAEHQYVVDVIEKVYNSLSSELKSNTIVMVSTCESSPWVFYEDLSQ